MLSAVDGQDFTQAAASALGQTCFPSNFGSKCRREKGLKSIQQDKCNNKGVAFKGTLNTKVIRSTRFKSNKKGEGEGGNLFQTTQRQMRQKADTELKKWSTDMDDI